jgi:tRNA threonylcarbamoyladenosine biosynthesis protein TsaE
MKKIIELFSEKDTEKFAEKLALQLENGDVIALYGELGAGKTFFTQKLCSFLKVTENVSSPSYVLMNEYSGIMPIVHLDLYRLNSEDEVLELGLYDVIESGLTIIEWPKLAEKLLTKDVIRIYINYKNKHREAIIKTEKEILL